MNNNLFTTGRLIFYYRKKLNMKQERLAFEMGVSQSKVSDWENDKVSPHIDQLLKIAKILCLHASELLPRPGKKDIMSGKDIPAPFVLPKQEEMYSYESIQEERKAYRQALIAKDEALQVKDEIIKALRRQNAN